MGHRDPAMNGHGSCMYRGPNDTKCAVGCLIPDSVYKPGMEWKTFVALMNKFPEIRQLFDGINAGLLANLQELHDCAHAPFTRDYLRDRVNLFVHLYPKLTLPKILND